MAGIETFTPQVKISDSDKIIEQVANKVSLETCMPLDRLVPGAIYDVGSDPFRDSLNEDALNNPLPSEKPALTDAEKSSQRISWTRSRDIPEIHSQQIQMLQFAKF